MVDCLEITVDEHVAHVRLNRPQKHNALNMEMFEALSGAADALARHDDVRAVVLSGRGENFCAGIDTTVFSADGVEDLLAELRPQTPPAPTLYQRAAHVWREVPVPVVCAVHGVAFGAGLQVALGADIRYAAPSTRFSIMEIKWGLVPDMALTETTRGIVRHDRLKELAFTGRTIDAGEAADAGLVTALHDDPLAAAMATAAEIAQKSPDAIRAMKRLLNASLCLDDSAALALEAELQLGVIGRPNQVEAVRANVEKRAPKFAG